MQYLNIEICNLELIFSTFFRNKKHKQWQFYDESWHATPPKIQAPQKWCKFNKFHQKLRIFKKKFQRNMEYFSARKSFLYTYYSFFYIFLKRKSRFWLKLKIWWKYRINFWIWISRTCNGVFQKKWRHQQKQCQRNDSCIL